MEGKKKIEVRFTSGEFESVQNAIKLENPNLDVDSEATMWGKTSYQSHSHYLMFFTYAFKYRWFPFECFKRKASSIPPTIIW